jgi:hypothetical protein
MMLEYIGIAAIAVVVFKVTLVISLQHMERRRWWSSYEIAAIIPMMIAGSIVSLAVAGCVVWILL